MQLLKARPQYLPLGALGINNLLCSSLLYAIESESQHYMKKKALNKAAWQRVASSQHLHPLLDSRQKHPLYT